MIQNNEQTAVQIQLLPALLGNDLCFYRRAIGSLILIGRKV